MSAILGSVGAEADSDKLSKLLSAMEGKDLAEVLESGRERMVAMPSGGGGGGGGSAPAAAAGGAAPAAAAAAPEEEEEEEEDTDDSSLGGSVTFDTNDQQEEEEEEEEEGEYDDVDFSNMDAAVIEEYKQAKRDAKRCMTYAIKSTLIIYYY